MKFGEKITIKFLAIYLALLMKAFAGTTIYIYGGDGVGEEGLVHTKYTLKKLVSHIHDIKEINAEEVTKGAWKQDALLFIMAGGRDQRYDDLLKPVGNSHIKSFVEGGGNFFAICGAAYYGGMEMEFAKETALQVTGSRELKFFPGLVQGPAFGGVREAKKNPNGYDYKSYAGAKAIEIQWHMDSPFPKETSFPIFYNGGPHFVNAQNLPENTTVLASYQVKEEESARIEWEEDEPKSAIIKWQKAPKSAIIECVVGQGRAILCGVHPEFDPESLRQSDKYLRNILPALWGANAQRGCLMEYLLNRLGVKTKNTHYPKL